MFEIIGFISIQIFLLIAGAAMGVLLLTCVFLLTRRVAPSWRKRVAMVIAFVFPTLAFFYLEAGLLVQEAMEYARGGDSIIFNGFFHVPLTNGYRLRFWNENPNSDGQLLSSEGQLVLTEGIKGIQVSGDHLFVHAEPREPQPGQGQPTVTVSHGVPTPLIRAGPPNQYLEIDTRTSAVTEHSSLEELRLAALARGASLQLISMDQAALSSPSELGWFHVVQFAPLLITSGWLLWKLRKLRGLSDQRAIRD